LKGKLNAENHHKRNSIEVRGKPRGIGLYSDHTKNDTLQHNFGERPSLTEREWDTPSVRDCGEKLLVQPRYHSLLPLWEHKYKAAPQKKEKCQSGRGTPSYDLVEKRIQIAMGKKAYREGRKFTG